jgi:hypothetical protein
MKRHPEVLSRRGLIRGACSLAGAAMAPHLVFTAFGQDLTRVITLTNDDGAPIQIDTKLVVRIRPVLRSEADVHNAATRIDYIFDVYVKESPDSVALQVKAGLATLARLALQNDMPIWFNGVLAEGPIPLAAHAYKETHSAFVLSKKRQFVKSSHQQVHDAIEANGGRALPIPSSTERSPDAALESIAPEGVWDSDLLYY